MILKSIYLLIILLCLSFSGCAKRENEPVQATQVNMDAAIEHIVNYQLRPLAQDFYASTQQLQYQAESFCAAPNQTQLNELREQWKNTHRRWYALSNYKFGPLILDPVFPIYSFIDAHRVRGTDFLVSVRDNLLQDLLKSSPVQLEDYQRKTYQYLGLLPIEVLLFETIKNKSPNTDDILQEYLQLSNKCFMLKGLVQFLNIHAQQIQDAWVQGYGENPYPFNEYLLKHLPSGEQPALTQILTAVQENLDYLHKRHVVVQVGQLANEGWQGLNASLKAIETLLVGDGKTRFTLFTLMRQSGQEASVQEVQKNLAFALQSIQEQDQTNLELALTLLDGNFKRTIPNALQINLGFNFLDGD
jgi:predicted lipoprotein